MSPRAGGHHAPQRVRLRRSHEWGLPFRTFYLVDTRDLPNVFRMFGPAYSGLLTTAFRRELRDKRIEYVGGKPCPSYWRGDGVPFSHGLVVVPLRFLRRDKGAICGLFSSRFHQGKGKTDEQIGGFIDAKSSVLHVGPRGEDIRPLCAFCSNQLGRLMNTCTPGGPVCAPNLVVPIDSLLGRANRRTRTP